MLAASQQLQHVPPCCAVAKRCILYYSRTVAVGILLPGTSVLEGQRRHWLVREIRLARLHYCRSRSLARLHRFAEQIRAYSLTSRPLAALL
jgi:hypothetical protein